MLKIAASIARLRLQRTPQHLGRLVHGTVQERLSSALVPPPRPLLLDAPPSASRRTFAKKTKNASASAKAKAPSSAELQRAANEYFDQALRAEYGGLLAGAEEKALACLRLRLAAFGGTDNHDHIVDALNVLGNIYMTANLPESAVPFLERAVEASLTVHGEQNAENQIPSLTSLALALQRLATPDFARAEELLERACSITDRRFGKTNVSQTAATLTTNSQSDLSERPHPQRARRLAELGVLRRAQNRDGEATALFERALAMRQQCYGDDSAYFDSVARENALLPTFGNSPSVSAVHERLAAEAPHPELCQSYGHIGMHRLAVLMAQAANASLPPPPEPATAAAADAADSPLPPASDDEARFASAIGALYRAVHLQHMHARVMQMRPNFAVHEALAAALTRRGRVAEAANVMHAATELCRARYGNEHAATPLALLNEAAILQLASLHVDFEAARSTNMQGGGGGGENDADSMSAAGAALAAASAAGGRMTGDEYTDRALQLLMQAFELAGARYGLAHAVVLRCASELVELLFLRRGHRQAAELIDEVVGIYNRQDQVAKQAPVAADSAEPATPSPLSPLPPLLAADSPFVGAYPSFTREPIEVHLAALHRARGVIAQTLREGGRIVADSDATTAAASTEADAAVPWVERARAEFQRALELLARAKVDPEFGAVKHLQSLLDRLPEK